MRFVNPLSPEAAADLDGLLRAFYRAEMPKPWPMPPVPASEIVPLRRPGQGLMRSRWVLAASVALLLLGSLLLPRRFAPDGKPEHGINGVPISDRNVLPVPPRKHEEKPIEKNDHPGFGVEEGDLLPDLDNSGFSLPK